MTTITTAKKTKYWEDQKIVDRFNTHKDIYDIHPDSAVNIYVGWPVFFEQIKYQAEVLGKKVLNILDFGCGAGEFAQKLHMQGHNVVGLDSSESLLKIAKNGSPKTIPYFLTENGETTGEYKEFVGQMDVVTAIHSLEWNENVNEIIDNLCEFLIPEGLLLFAIFPKEHVKDSLKIKDLFEDFDSEEDPEVGFCNFEGVKIPVYIRDAIYFDELLLSKGFEKVLEFYPHYPKSFLNKYKWNASLKPEMLILAYRKAS